MAAERNGRWSRAIEVPGLGALNAGAVVGGGAEVTSVSCASAGSCAAGGHYADRFGLPQGFVAVERNGRWGKAIEVPGLGALNKGFADVAAVSCGAADSCAAGGYYNDRDLNFHGFVATARNGVWGKAIEVPGLAALNKGGDAQVGSVSCASAGSCAAGGHYDDGHGDLQGFVAAERNGRWDAAIEVPGLGALNTFGSAEVRSVSCASPGSCAAGGHYGTRRALQGFVAAERHGRWARRSRCPAWRP